MSLFLHYQLFSTLWCIIDLHLFFIPCSLEILINRSSVTHCAKGLHVSFWRERVTFPLYGVTGSSVDKTKSLTFWRRLGGREEQLVLSQTYDRLEPMVLQFFSSTFNRQKDQRTVKRKQGVDGLSERDGEKETGQRVIDNSSWDSILTLIGEQQMAVGPNWLRRAVKYGFLITTSAINLKVDIWL